MAYYPLKVKDGSGNVHTVGDPRTQDKADKASPALTGTPTAPTAAAGTNTTQIATTAFVSTAVANVIDGAPGALDTLNELAQALGDDPNYVTSITSALALKAPLASPSLTGTPAAPTAAADTDTTQIATTAFVIGQAASTAPADNGTAAVGTSKKFARADHVHKASASVVMSTSEPSSPTDGMVWVDSDSDVATFDPDTLIAKSLISGSKGALVTSTGSAVAAQTVGSNDTILVADSGQTNGIKWAALTASQVPTLEATKVPTQVQAAKTDSYTLVLSDAGKLIEMGKATAQTLTIPTNSSVAFPVGTKIDVLQTGAGETTIAGAGVTINSEGSKLKLNAQWAAATLIKRATDTWVVIGSLKA